MFFKNQHKKQNSSNSPLEDRGKSIKVLAPATIANLVCGFDVLGLALKDPQDIMEVFLTDEPGIRIEHIDNYKLSTIVEENVAGVSLLALMQELNENIGFNIIIDKRIKPGSGLGSSAASAAGVVVAANWVGGVITIYDNTAGSGTVIMQLDTGSPSGGLLSSTGLPGPAFMGPLGINFTTGLTVVTSSSTSNDVTIIYQ